MAQFSTSPIYKILNNYANDKLTLNDIYQINVIWSWAVEINYRISSNRLSNVMKYSQ